LIESGIEVVAVVTNPDRPAGRGLQMHAPPVKEVALDAGIEVHQPSSARDPELGTWLEGLSVDVATVVAYGKILPAPLLEVPTHGFVNVHFSLLPRYRGAAPVQRAVMAGDPTTGTSIMVLTEGMDEGPVVAIEEVPIEPDETAGELGMRLAQMSGPLLVRSLDGFVSGSVVPAPQDDSAATYAPKIGEAEARIDWTAPARRVHDLVRGLNPAPGAWTMLGGRRVKVHRTRVGVGPDLAPGTLSPDGAHAGTGDGPIELVEVQMEGRKRMSGMDLARGLRFETGTAFE
jgi:methionyl-tRNA formyltransferase